MKNLFFKSLLLSLTLAVSVASFSQPIPVTHGIVDISKVAYDTDAQAFISAAGITDVTQKRAINQLVIDYKAAGIWGKMTAIYPFVGGTSTTHSYNLKDPTLYQITWGGTVTHNANGITGNGSTGYGDTGVNPSLVLSLNDTHISYYSRTNSAATQFVAIGVSRTSDFFIGAYPTSVYGSVNNTVSLVGTIADTRGEFLISRTSSTSTTMYRNGGSIAMSSSASTSLSNANIYVGARNNTGALNYSTTNISLATIGAGLNSTEVTNKYTADAAFQTTLGR